MIKPDNEYFNNHDLTSSIDWKEGDDDVDNTYIAI